MVPAIFSLMRPEISSVASLAVATAPSVDGLHEYVKNRNVTARSNNAFFVNKIINIDFISDIIGFNENLT